MKNGALLLPVVLASLLCLADSASARTGLIRNGHPFPGLVLPSAEDGTPLSIASFRGEKVIVQVFASW